MPESAPKDLPPLVHGIEAEDWQASWNMHLAGTRTSIDFTNELHLRKPGLRDLPLENMRRGELGEVFLSPRMMCLWQAAVIRSGGWIGEGVPPYPTRKMPKAECERALRLADLELRIEEMRRDLAPTEPSRIGCLYLAEDTAVGRSMVSRLKGLDAFILKVTVTYCLRIARVDAKWLNEPTGDGEIAGYWSSEPRDDQPHWEYLLDGAIRCADEEEFERLRAWGWTAGARASGSQGRIGTPRD